MYKLYMIRRRRFKVFRLFTSSSNVVPFVRNNNNVTIGRFEYRVMANQSDSEAN